MKSKWPAYAASLLATAAVVASTVFLPQALIGRQARALLGQERILVNGHYQSRPYPKPTDTPTASPSPTATPMYTGEPTSPALDDRSRQILEKVLLMEDTDSTRQFQREPGDGEMDMKKAVNTCIKLLMERMKTRVMPSLANFPDDYEMTAYLNTVVSLDGLRQFDYWTISFYTNPEVTKSNGGISLMMDAETGDILQFKMYAGGKAAESVSIGDATKLLATSLGINGKLMLTDGIDDGSESAVWISSDKKLFLNVYLTAGKDSASMSMNISTKMPFR